ncbi:MAG TPA: polysaccharide deacetylase family protein [Sediminibacterium sp.]|nr:polysaccharide deacetylase family protein [Sediminibacterium sp.]
MYFVKTPWWLRSLYPLLTWRIPVTDKVIYLSFDDGPHEQATVFALDQLQQFNAKATFFCIGKNVQAYPGIYERIWREGHRVGNHTQNHLNGWKTSDQEYLKDIEAADRVIPTGLFRPPYGRIRRSQVRQLLAEKKQRQIVMWDVLSGDFDTGISPALCLQRVLRNTQSGSVIVMHDSTKAWERMSYALPRMLEYFTEAGYRFEVIPDNKQRV